MRMIRNMGQAFFSGHLGTITKDNFSTITVMGMGKCFGLMEVITKVSGRKGLSKVKGSCINEVKDSKEGISRTMYWCSSKGLSRALNKPLSWCGSKRSVLT